MATDWVKALRGLAGESVRAATTEDAVAGVTPQVVVAPADEAVAAAVLAFADDHGLKVLVRGGGTQLRLGNPPSGGDILLSMECMNHVIAHAPHDMTVTVQPGLSLSALQHHLAETRQWLALDPVPHPWHRATRLTPSAGPSGAPFIVNEEGESLHPSVGYAGDSSAEVAGPTIGGIIATNATGARRLRYGGVRDQIIGVRVVLADGTIAKGGGQVVKNVAGYDLPKLFTGSLGTLGVITAATFRLYPLPAFSQTAVIASGTAAEACALAQQIAASSLTPSALDIFGDKAREDCTVAVRFEAGSEDAVAEQCAALVGIASPTRFVRDEEEAAFWAEADMSLAVPAMETMQVPVKASLLRTGIPHWLERLVDAARSQAMQASWRAHAGHGIVYARLVGADQALVDAVTELRAAAVDRNGSLVVLDLPPVLASQLDAWGTTAAVDLMRRIKAQFDPHSTLNPGRFVGGI